MLISRPKYARSYYVYNKQKECITHMFCSMSTPYTYAVLIVLHVFFTPPFCGKIRW